MNEKYESPEQRLQAADPAVSASPLGEDILSTPGARHSATRLPRKLNSSALVGAGTGVAAIALALNLSLAGVSSEPLITLGDNSNARNQSTSLASGSAPEGLANDVASTDKMMIWQDYNYIAGSDLSTEAGTGFIYKVSKVGEPRAILQNLADYFGVAGKPSTDEYSTPEYPSYSISGDNYYLNINWSGTGSWSYGSWTNAVWEECVYPLEDSRSSTEEAVDSETVDSETVDALPLCKEPVPTPELIPSKSQLQSEAFELFSATGFNGSISDVVVYRDEWGAWANASYLVDGQPVAIDWSAGWGSDGKLSWAGGHSVSIEKVDGSFGTISPSAAVERLNDGGWWGGLPYSFYASNAVTSEAAASYPMTDGERQTIEVTVGSAESVLLTVYDATGNTWLVPGYAMNHDLGWFDAVIAVEDGVIELPDYSDVMPMDSEVKTSVLVD